jgi:protein regulator of cytokinesis 1
MRRRREERRRKFSEVTELINRIEQEMKPSKQLHLTMDNSDLTIRRLEELRAYLQDLQLEKVGSDNIFFGCIEHSLS